MWVIGRKGDKSLVEKEPIIGQFFQPMEKLKLAIMLIILVGIIVFFLFLWTYLYSILPRDFPESLFVFLFVFLCGLSATFALYYIDKAKIGKWFIVTQTVIRQNRKYIPWENIKAISYLRIGAENGISSHISRRITTGIYLLTISPWQIREMVDNGKKSIQSLYNLSKEIIKNSLVIPLKVENLPQLIDYVFEFAHYTSYDIESFLLSQLKEGNSLLASSSDLFQARIYDGRSAFASLHSFYTGINHLLKLELSPAQQNLEKSLEEGEHRARPYLAFALFLQGKYRECVSLLEGNNPPPNRGEVLILLSSLAKLGKWEELQKWLNDYCDNYSEPFRLGVLCAFKKYDELISIAKKRLREKYEPSLELCLKCADELRSRVFQPVPAEIESSKEAKWRKYLYTFLLLIGYLVFSFFHGWAKGLGALLYLFVWSYDVWLRRYMEMEAYVQFVLFLRKTISIPFWCSFRFIPETYAEKKSSPLGKS